MQRKKPTNREMVEMISFLNRKCDNMEMMIGSLAEYINDYIDLNKDRDNLKKFIDKKQKEILKKKKIDKSVHNSPAGAGFAHKDSK